MSQPSSQISKSELRISCRAKRAGIPATQREAWNAAINRTVGEKARELDCKTIAAFSSFDGEPDLTAVLIELENRGVRLALPVLDANLAAGMVMRQWSPAADLLTNSFGIREPVNGLEIPLTEIDLVLMPLVGWDVQGNRLGMGAGYYDRLFEPLKVAAKPIRVGVAFAVQRVAKIPADSRDVPMHALINENGWTRFTRGVQAR